MNTGDRVIYVTTEGVAVPAVVDGWTRAKLPILLLESGVRLFGVLPSTNGSAGWRAA